MLVFGDPAVGTALMQAQRRAGIDLPLRLLVRAEGGRTRLGYRDPRVLVADPAVAPVLAKLNAYSSGWRPRLPGAGDRSLLTRASPG